jgi:hypothetical protein
MFKTLVGIIVIFPTKIINNSNFQIQEKAAFCSNKKTEIKFGKESKHISRGFLHIETNEKKNLFF